VTALEAKGVMSPALPRIDLTCGVGLHAIVAADPVAAAALVAIASGLARPRRGTLRVQGKDPFRTPELRSLTGTLLDSEEPIQGRSLEESLGRALALHQSPLRAADVLEPFGLSLLVTRPPNALSRAELRAVALALALSLNPVSLLVLHEPFATSLDRARVASSLAARALATIVLVVTASQRDARALGGRVFTLTRAGLTQWNPLGGAFDGAVELTASVDDPGRIAAALALAPANSGFDCEKRPFGIVLSGGDATEMSLALLRASDASGVAITRLSHRFVGGPGGMLLAGAAAPPGIPPAGPSRRPP
jgi:energy-coupling factor transporter ATP-binding protein EcfA2